jgi:hypothetical protein
MIIKEFVNHPQTMARDTRRRSQEVDKNWCAIGWRFGVAEGIYGNEPNFVVNWEFGIRYQFL